jgi:hypothetical protein
MPRTPEQIWQQLVDESGEDEIERAASMSVAQAERELRGAGFDLRKQRAQAEAELRELTDEAPHVARKDDVSDADPGEPAAWVSVPPPSSRPASSARWTLLIAAALAAAATAGGVIYAAAHRHKPDDNPVEVPQPMPGPQIAPQPKAAPSSAPADVKPVWGGNSESKPARTPPN